MAGYPARIDDYTVGNLISEGLTGSTFAATTEGRDGRLLQTVVKFCHPERSVTLDSMSRLERDCGSSSVIRYLAVGTKAKRWAGYYAVDLFRPVAVGALLGQATLEERLELCAKVADGIAALHGLEKAIVHGNLKPSNVLVRRERGKLLPIITDVGVRPVYSAEFHDVPERARALYPYLAPEVVQAFRSGGAEAMTELQPTADVYALGTLLCEFLTGTVPGTSEWETTLDEFLAAKEQPGYFINALFDPRAPVDLDKVNAALASALAREPGDRPPAAQFASALRSACLEPQASV